MKLIVLSIALLSFSAIAGEKTYSCVSDTNLKFFQYGDSDKLNIIANNWGGNGFFHIERGEFPVFLNELKEEDVYSLSLEGFGGAKANTEIMLSKEIKSLQDKESIVFIDNPEIGEQIYFCQPIEWNCKD